MKVSTLTKIAFLFSKEEKQCLESALKILSDSYSEAVDYGITEFDDAYYGLDSILDELELTEHGEYIYEAEV